MGKFGSPHKLCIIRTLEFVYFSFFGGHAVCSPWVNLEVPINCVLLRHWNKYVFPFWGHSARAQWVNLEVPINCVLLEHCNLYIFPFLGACHVCSMGKFGGPHKLCIIRTLEFVYFSFFLEVPINWGTCHGGMLHG